MNQFYLNIWIQDRSEGLCVANIMGKFGHLGARAPVGSVGVHPI